MACATEGAGRVEVKEGGGETEAGAGAEAERGSSIEVADEHPIYTINI